MNEQPDNPLLKQRIESERSLIGSAFIAPGETRTTCGWLKPEAFWLKAAADFWREYIAGGDAFVFAGLSG